MISVGHLFFLCVVLAGVIRVGYAVTHGRAASVTITALAIFMWTFCLLLPAHLQSQGAIQSKLDRANLIAPPTSSELDASAFRWGLEILVVLVAEIIVSRIRWSAFRDSSTGEGISESSSSSIAGQGLASYRWRHTVSVVAILLLIGVAAYIAFPPPALEARADEGQGLATVLRGVLICALALLAYFRCFRSRLAFGLLALGVLYLAYLNVRSPLVVIFLAFLASEINTGRLRSKKRLAALAVASMALALLASVMSDLRGNQTQRLGATNSEVVTATLEDPFVAPYRAGIDTLDGYRLSEYVLPRVGARPDGLLAVATNFVPRALWENKPQSLAVEISSDYLNYRASGQFLSPTGFLMLVTGSYLGGLVGLFVFSILGTVALRLSAHTPWLAIILVVIFRFFLGGSSFDVYYGFTLAIPILAVRVLVNSQDVLASRIRGVQPIESPTRRHISRRKGEQLVRT